MNMVLIIDSGGPYLILHHPDYFTVMIGLLYMIPYKLQLELRS